MEDNTSATFGNGPEKVWLERAKDNFRRGEYGLAERYYRQAIEERHNNVEAWLGLAASYDRLKRFDEADRAYKVVTVDGWQHARRCSTTLATTIC